MAKIEANSQTWLAVLSFIEQQRDEAIKNLIVGAHSEQQRGAIRCLDKLAELANKEDETHITEIKY